MLTEENQRMIAHEISMLCEQERDNPNLKRLQRLLKENSKQKTNLLESLKVGKASATAVNYVLARLTSWKKRRQNWKNKQQLRKIATMDLVKSI